NSLEIVIVLAPLKKHGPNHRYTEKRTFSSPGGLSRNADAPRRSCPVCLSSNGFVLTLSAPPSAALRAGSLIG
ncbi:MAG: hypothetical protein Q4P24_15265, partial [Rhodobacterales bacterium]|nr:hypothetical protein [Rhodobacterales bacterium]